MKNKFLHTRFKFIINSICISFISDSYIKYLNTYLDKVTTLGYTYIKVVFNTRLKKLEEKVLAYAKIIFELFSFPRQTSQILNVKKQRKGNKDYSKVLSNTLIYQIKGSIKERYENYSKEHIHIHLNPINKNSLL